MERLGQLLIFFLFYCFGISIFLVSYKDYFLNTSNTEIILGYKFFINFIIHIGLLVIFYLYNRKLSYKSSIGTMHVVGFVLFFIIHTAILFFYTVALNLLIGLGGNSKLTTSYIWFLYPFGLGMQFYIFALMLLVVDFITKSKRQIINPH